MTFRVLSCPSCRAQFEPRDARPRCPVCGARFAQIALAEPAAPEDEDPGLEAPAFLSDVEPTEKVTSLVELAAAIACLAGLSIFIAGFVFASPVAFMGGFVIVFVVIGAVCIHNWWVRARNRWDRDGRPDDRQA